MKENKRLFTFCIACCVMLISSCCMVAPVWSKPGGDKSIRQQSDDNEKMASGKAKGKGKKSAKKKVLKKAGAAAATGIAVSKAKSGIKEKLTKEGDE